MIQHSMIEDVSLLTTIPQTTLEKLSGKVVYCICDSVEEATLKEDNSLALKIGIGTLRLEIKNDTVTYRFEPSKELEDSINRTIRDGKSPLENKVETTLVKKLLNTYKDFL